MRVRSNARAIIAVAVATSVVAVVLTATAPALGQAPAASPDVSAAPSTEVAAPVPSPSSSASPATSAGADGLILFSTQVAIDDGAGITHCSMFHTIRPDGSDERQLPVACMLFGNASWGPAGDGIVFDLQTLSNSTIQIDESSADGSDLTNLLMLSGSFPAFSPDGSQIAFQGAGGIFIAAADGTNRRQLASTPDPANNSYLWPRFSPDGSRIAFTRMTNGSDTIAGASEVWMVNTDGTDLHQLTAAPPESYYARWSSDGSRLLLTGSQTATGDVGLWTINADGTGLTPVTTGTGGRDHFGDWSPDGSRIVYTNFDSGVNSLRVMNADGSGVTTLLSNAVGNSGGYGLPDWGLPGTPRPEVP